MPAISKKTALALNRELHRPWAQRARKRGFEPEGKFTRFGFMGRLTRHDHFTPTEWDTVNCIQAYLDGWEAAVATYCAFPLYINPEDDDDVLDESLQD